MAAQCWNFALNGDAMLEIERPMARGCLKGAPDGGAMLIIDTRGWRKAEKEHLMAVQS
jgi:hypothetical protein